MYLTKEAWFDEWFSSPYYHILYKHRDANEARRFLNNLCALLCISRDEKILDLACGRGRHSIYLNNKGLDVTGIDISGENIRFARQFENNRLRFYVHDMRKIFRENAFDYVFNFFTSFGYFDTSEENEYVVHSAEASLIEGGILLIDFLNPYMVIHDMTPEEKKIVDGIEFRINRTLREDGYIIKHIHFSIGDQDFHFREKVKAIRRIEFMEYFASAGLRLLDMFGDYDLNPYEPEKSDRMIFLLKK